MREAAKVLSEASSLTITGQPLVFSTRLIIVRINSRGVIDFSDNDGSSSESKIKAACPFFLFFFLFSHQNPGLIRLLCQTPQPI
jgi:hypothetical protein